VQDAHVRHGGGAPVGNENHAAGHLEPRGQASHVDGDAVPALLAPGVPHGNAQVMRTPGERDGDEVIDPVDSRVDGVDQIPAILKHEGGGGFAFHADVHAVLNQAAAVTR